MRLDRFVSQAAGVSRADARDLVRRGRVQVDGIAEKRPAAAVSERAEVHLDGLPLATPQPLYLMLHKPAGVVSATVDDRQPTVNSLLPAPLARRVHPVGRLDKATTGLLLLTDDGAWSHRITAPRYHCAKVYRATLAEALVADAAERLAAGLMLRGEARPVRPARLQRLSATEVRIEVTEGRYHLVRRLFAALGNRVLTLHRERVGGVSLDPQLRPGQWRRLTDEERRWFFSSAD
jgi:16S rRNA pseudouridine516 synthase